MYTHIKVQDALEVMEARKPSLSLLTERYSKDIVRKEIGRDINSNMKPSTFYGLKR